MNKKIFRILCVVLLGMITYFGFSKVAYSSKPMRIGILIPMDHAALRDIVAGFEAVVKDAFPNSVTFNVQSAQGDIKLQRSIIELFVGQKMDMIVPVGTTATQMTLSLVKQQPIVSLAALYPEEARQKRHPRNITGVLDEIGGKKKLDFIRAIIPHLKTMTLIFHGANEKTQGEVEALKTYSQAMGINLQIMMIQNLPELETAGKAVAAHSQAILILKDHLIASGIRILVAIAKDRSIPLMTGDEGTVQEGATVALGVQERMIGEAGGKLAVKILQGYPIQDLPMEAVPELAVFYNGSLLASQHIDITQLREYAHKNQYPFINKEHSAKLLSSQ